MACHANLLCTTTWISLQPTTKNFLNWIYPRYLGVNFLTSTFKACLEVEFKVFHPINSLCCSSHVCLPFLLLEGATLEKGTVAMTGKKENKWEIKGLTLTPWFPLLGKRKSLSVFPFDLLLIKLKGICTKSHVFPPLNPVVTLLNKRRNSNCFFLVSAH